MPSHLYYLTVGLGYLFWKDVFPITETRLESTAWPSCCIWGSFRSPSCTYTLLCLKRCLWPWICGQAKGFQVPSPPPMRLTSQQSKHQRLENTLPSSDWGVYPAWAEKNRHSRFLVAKRQALESCLLCSRSVSPLWHHIKLYRQPLVLNWCTELRVVGWASSLLLGKWLKRCCSSTDLWTLETGPESRGVRATAGRAQLWAEDTMIVAELLDHGLRGTLP